jgi:hypothetical protein
MRERETLVSFGSGEEFEWRYSLGIEQRKGCGNSTLSFQEDTQNKKLAFEMIPMLSSGTTSEGCYPNQQKKQQRTLTARSNPYPGRH